MIPSHHITKRGIIVTTLCNLAVHNFPHKWSKFAYINEGCLLCPDCLGVYLLNSKYMQEYTLDRDWTYYYIDDTIYWFCRTKDLIEMELYDTHNENI